MSPLPRRPPSKRARQQLGRRALRGEILDVCGVAELLGTTEKLVRARMARGQLPYRRWGGRLIFLRREVLEFFDELPGMTAHEVKQIGGGAG